MFVKFFDNDETESMVEKVQCEVSNFNGKAIDENEFNSNSEGKEDGTRLKKELKARHISMIAIGGSLGTGLSIGTGTALRTAGPVANLISYSFFGILVFFTMACFGEMTTYIQLDGFTSYATRYCDPTLGFAVGYSYLFKYFIITPNQLTAAALVIQYWAVKDTVNPGAWIAIFLVVIVAINTVGVRYFGEFEFWLLSFKIIIMIGVILFLLVIMLGCSLDHDILGFRYWKGPGAFKPYSSSHVKIEGGLGKFGVIRVCSRLCPVCIFRN